jgi:1,4-alpha-glucan branching enzyme
VPDSPDTFVDALAGDLRAPVPLSPRVTAGIMAAVRADAARRRRRTRHYQFLAAAAVILAAVAGIIVVRERPEAGTVVQFSLPVAAASEVAVVGDFNGWDMRATPLKKTAGGLWRASVRLKPGAHVYSFVVDGNRWVPDPAAPTAPGSDFGSPNSLVTVAPGAT